MTWTRFMTQRRFKDEKLSHVYFDHLNKYRLNEENVFAINGIKWLDQVAFINIVFNINKLWKHLLIPIMLYLVIYYAIS